MAGLATLRRPATLGPDEAEDPESLADRGDRLFLVGCVVCGTWVLGPIGAVLLVMGMRLMKQAQEAGAAIRPWPVTILGGLILVDSSVNILAWGLDLFPAHDTAIGRTLWINYGLFGDGGYAINYNTTELGGVHVHAEKAVQIFMVFLAMPLKLAAAWGFLKMTRWGLQWTIIAHWMYFGCWAAYLVDFAMNFDLRWGVSEFGLLGFLLINIPFFGPVIMLPYLHSVNRELWSKD